MTMTIKQLWELAVQFRYEQDYPEDIPDENLPTYTDLVALSIWMDSNLEDRLDIVRWEFEQIEHLTHLAAVVFDDATLAKWKNLVEFETASSK